MRITIRTEYWEKVRTAPAAEIRKVFDWLTEEENKRPTGTGGMKVLITGAGCKGGKHWHIREKQINTLEQKLEELHVETVEVGAETAAPENGK